MFLQLDKQNATPPSQQLRLLSHHDLEHLSELTKIRRKKGDEFKLQLINSMLAPSAPNFCHDSPSISLTSYDHFPETLQSRTTAHQPSNMWQNKWTTVKRQAVHFLAFAEEFPNEIHEATAKRMRRNACDSTIARRLYIKYCCAQLCSLRTGRVYCCRIYQSYQCDRIYTVWKSYVATARWILRQKNYKDESNAK